MILKLLKGNPYGENIEEEKALYKAYEEGKIDQRAADQIEVEKLTDHYNKVVEAFVDHIKKLESEIQILKGKQG
jgi:predicted RNase H-like nuclease (RuvC/YqgF family)